MTAGRRRSRPRGDRTRKALAVVALLAAFALLATMVGAMVGQFFADDPPADTATPVTSAAPVGPPIRPLPIRPVISATPVTPQQPCPPPGPPPPPAAPLSACDVIAGTRYELGPEAITLALTGVRVVPAGNTGFFAIQVTMDRASADLLAQYTSGHLDTAMALIRDRAVVSAPTVSAPIFSDAIELSGELSRQQADQLAAMLRQPL